MKILSDEHIDDIAHDFYQMSYELDNIRNAIKQALKEQAREIRNEYVDCVICPYEVNNSYQRDCAWPDCQGGWDAVWCHLSDDRDNLKTERDKYKGLLKLIVMKVDENHSTKFPPQKYIVPWGLINEAREALTSTEQKRNNNDKQENQINWHSVVYRYLSLSAWYRRDIAQKLSVIDDNDKHLSDVKQSKLWCIRIKERNLTSEFLIELDKVTGQEQKSESDQWTKCPQCGGEADNGHDRCLPPSAYLCTKCFSQWDEEENV